ncbi:MAG: hypothetical protein IJT98_01065 [Prevotella sp.]|nr:hypothetical protein [Prevotella sp.]
MLITSIKNKDLSLVAQCRATGENVFIETDDNAIINRLLAESAVYDLKANGGHRLECYIVFDGATALWLLQNVGLPKDVQDKADVVATTAADLLAKTLFVKLPHTPDFFPFGRICNPTTSYFSLSLDRQPINADSDSTVHLVLCGISDLTEALAVNAALVAHYPNYCRDSRLRTRITIIDNDIDRLRSRLMQRYQHLFDNSYHRSIDLTQLSPAAILHRPQYEHRRQDFVDVEWEFVRGNIRSEAVRQKLSQWSQSPRQQLTVALVHDTNNTNFDEAFSLPDEVYRNNIPVLCHLSSSDMVRMVAAEGSYRNVLPINADDCSLCTLRTLKQLAMRVNYVYGHCFALSPDDPITAPASIPVEELEPQWTQIGSLTKQYSNIYNAMTLGTKMHSLGHREDDWQQCYALSADEIEVLTAVEHNRWSVEELILGYRPLTDDEQHQVEQDTSLKKKLRNELKAHYDLRAFDDLRADDTGKNSQVYDQVLTQGIPLIIKSCISS